MTKEEKRLIVPTAEEIAAAEQVDATKTTGVFSWIRKRKLRMRTHVGSRRSAPKSPSSTTTGSPEGEALSPQDLTELRSSKSPATGAEPVVRQAAEGPTPTDTGESNDTTSTEASPPRRRKVSIKKEALDRRTGRQPKPTPRQGKPSAPRLIQGPGYGRCTCGQMFYGPPDVVMAEFATHRCGRDRGEGREDWRFDR
jgi:hypothetical protein